MALKAKEESRSTSEPSFKLYRIGYWFGVAGRAGGVWVAGADGRAFGEAGAVDAGGVEDWPVVAAGD